jgi:hypothetical protein
MVREGSDRMQKVKFPRLVYNWPRFNLQGTLLLIAYEETKKKSLVLFVKDIVKPKKYI